jgi:hypothetical protein
VPDPTFLLIGGQKCGTTWMARMLAEHPQVFVPDRKELRFYDCAEHHARGLAWYRAQFAGAGDVRAVGECTPNYLGVHEVPSHARATAAAHGLELDGSETRDGVAELVARDFPDVRLVVVLRNPVERARSSWYHQISAGRVSPRLPFRAVAGEHGIVSMGFYAHHLRRWLARFDRDRLVVFLYEDDLVGGTEALLARLYEHVGVDPSFVPVAPEARHGQRLGDAAMFGRYYAPRVTRRVLRVAPALARLPAPVARLTDDDLTMLDALYGPDIDELEEILGRSLATWRAR